MNKLIAQGLIEELEKATGEVDMFWQCANIGAITNSCWPEWSERWQHHKQVVSNLNYAPLREKEHRVRTIEQGIKDYYDDLHHFLSERSA